MLLFVKISKVIRFSFTFILNNKYLHWCFKNQCYKQVVVFSVFHWCCEFSIIWTIFIQYKFTYTTTNSKMEIESSIWIIDRFYLISWWLLWNFQVKKANVTIFFTFLILFSNFMSHRYHICLFAQQTHQTREFIVSTWSYTMVILWNLPIP